MFNPKPNTRDPQLIPAAPARRHVEQLIAAGYTPGVIAHCAGLETRRITTLLGSHTERGSARNPGYEHRIYQRVADALLAIPMPDGLFVDATGTARRLRALVRLGHPFDLLAAEVGYPEDLIRELALGRPSIVDAELADHTTEVFDRWCLTPGPCGHAREFGRRHRFAAPLAWAIDDEDEAGAIDDPNATPVGLPPSDDRAWRKVPPDFTEIVDEHRDLGHFDEEIANAMGITLDTFAKRLHRAGIRERRRGDGRHHRTRPIYGARYAVRLPQAMAGVAS